MKIKICGTANLSERRMFELWIKMHMAAEIDSIRFKLKFGFLHCWWYGVSMTIISNAFNNLFIHTIIDMQLQNMTLFQSHLEESILWDRSCYTIDSFGSNTTTTKRKYGDKCDPQKTKQRRLKSLERVYERVEWARAHNQTKSLCLLTSCVVDCFFFFLSSSSLSSLHCCSILRTPYHKGIQTLRRS